MNGEKQAEKKTIQGIIFLLQHTETLLCLFGSHKLPASSHPLAAELVILSAACRRAHITALLTGWLFQQHTANSRLQKDHGHGKHTVVLIRLNTSSHPTE